VADARRLGPRQLMRIRRRRFLGQILLVLAGVTGRIRAQGLAVHFRPLARPVVVPLDDMATPWRARSFTAEGVTLASAATPNQPLRIAGMVVRTAAGGNQPDRFAAVCARCPHEGCDVDFVADPNQLPQDVKDEIGHPVANAVYICPCHNSTFKAEDGERLAGPAPRGLYRFHITGASDAAVEIAEVEEDVLIFL
jgi:Rieske Fe-S protein